MATIESPVRIAVDAEQVIDGDLAVPDSAVEVVVFAHGSGSSRFSSRNRFVAEQLRRRRLATLLIDLLTPEEERIDERTRDFRFDVAMLARRLVAARMWLAERAGVADLPVGYFGASTGAAAALIAAADQPAGIAAVVSRGGRPDLAAERLPLVQAPTLLIVGGADEAVLELNDLARRRMRAETDLRVVPGATHLFEEPGTLEAVAQLAGDWFASHVTAGRPEVRQI